MNFSYSDVLSSCYVEIVNGNFLTGLRSQVHLHLERL